MARDGKASVMCVEAGGQGEVRAEDGRKVMYDDWENTSRAALM